MTIRNPGTFRNHLAAGMRGLQGSKSLSPKSFGLLIKVMLVYGHYAYYYLILFDLNHL